MIAVDSNIVVRFLVRDSESQYGKAESLFLNQHLIVPVTVVLECEWVLRRVYAKPKMEILASFDKLLAMTNVEFGEQDAVSQAILWCREGLDFADALHLALSRPVEVLHTFDRAFASAAAKLNPPIAVRLES